MKLIPLTGKYGVGKFAQVDDEDADRVSQHRWSLTKNGYAVSSIVVGTYDFYGLTKNIYRSVFLHRFVMNDYNSSAYRLDHHDLNKLNCQKDNLRKATHRQNSVNVAKNTKIITSSKYKGVTYIKKRSHLETPYHAAIQVNNTKKDLGYWQTEEKAAYVYDISCIKFNKEFACLNFPLENYKDLNIDEEINKLRLEQIEIQLERKKKVNTSRYWNVYFYKYSNNSINGWHSFISVNSVSITKSHCETEYEAALRADKEAFRVYGKNYNHFNFLFKDLTIEELEREIKKIEIEYESRTRRIGLTWHKRDKRWNVRIAIGGEHIYIGRHKEEVIAKRLYDLYAIKLYGDAKQTNFPFRNYEGLDIDAEIEKINKTNKRPQREDSGITWNKKRQKWTVYILVKGKPMYWGRYKTIEEARVAKKEAEEKYNK